MKRKLCVITMLTFCISLSLLYSSVDPAWYSFDLHENPWLTNGNYNIDWGSVTRSQLGYYHIYRSGTYPNTASWQDSDMIWGEEEKNLTFILTTTYPSARLIHTEDPNKYLDMSYVINTSGSEETIDQYITELEGVMDHYLGSNILINISLPTSNHEYYKGSYTSPLKMEIYAEYGTENQVKLAQGTYTVSVYYKKKSNDPQIETSLEVVKYQNAENIDAHYVTQPGNTINVGSVSFTSNDKKKSNSYSIKISPKIDPLVGKFLFIHENNSSTFPYKVHVPGRTIPSLYTFEVQVPSPIGNTTWNDFFEIGISGVTFPQENLLAGEYSSTIVIELEKN